MKYEAKHLEHLRRIFPLMQFAEQSRKDVMPTRQELEMVGVFKNDVKDLVKHGYIKTETLMLRENQLVCGRVVHYMTPKAIELLLATGAIKENAPQQITEVEKTIDKSQGIEFEKPVESNNT